MARIAIIQFPGSNCEYETATCVREAGGEADIISWTVSESELESYDAYILPGGFSFQDRVRAGVMSSKIPLLKHLRTLSDQGKPILGICNGCQILAESGLVPDLGGENQIEMACAPNMKDGRFHGFSCEWVYVRVSNPEASVFTRAFKEGDILPIQINHGEGNITFKDNGAIEQSSCAQLTYCSSEGEVIAEHPCNPNGASLNCAGISNAKGNVLAMMPHPERGSFTYQLPRHLHDSFGEAKRSRDWSKEGPWHPLFRSLVESISS